MRRYFFIFFYCCFCITQLHAQTGNLVFKHINRANGLPVDEVTCLAQDSTGFIWIGSKEGLFRFDGFNYKSFYHTPGNTQTIPGNFISKLHVDKQGLLWIGTNSGAALMKNNGQLIKVLNSGTESLFSKFSDDIYDIKEDKKKFWISTGNGLFSVSKNGTQISGLQKHDLKKKFRYSTNQLGTIVIDRDGQLWISTLHGLVIYDPEKKELVHAGNNPDSLNILKEKNAFRSLLIDETKRTIRYSTWEPAIRSYNIDENKTTTIYSGKGSENPDFGNLISQFLKDDHGILWMATGKGIKTIDHKNSEQIIHHQQGNPYSIRSDYVTSLLQDKEGSIWAGTGEGISITQPYRQTFVNLSGNSVEEYPFAKSAVNIIIPVNANSFLISGDGLYRTDASFKVQEHYSFGTSKYDWIWKYYRQGNSIYISAQEGNLLYDVKTQQLQKLTESPFDKFYPISSFVPGKNGSIWMSRYHNQFLKYSPHSKQYKIYSLQELGEESSIIQLAKDNENNLWILSSTTGLFRFDETKEKIAERLLVNKNNSLQAPPFFLKDIGEELLIGYVTKGISLYNKKNKSFRHFSRSDGLISNSVIDALQTDKSTVWIVTRNGISRFDLLSNTFTNYSYDNGILQNDFECIALLPNGRIAAGNKKGLVYFSPDEINASPTLSPPIITNMNVYGNDLPVDSFSQHTPLHISYNKNYFSFDYISLQYQNNQQIEYAYMLEGFDKDWVPAGTRRFASYSNVSGGNYNLRIKARVAGGSWVESKSSFPVVVHTAFYKQAWFYVLCTIILAGIIYTIFRYRLNQVLHFAKMRTVISSDLHDEVGATLTSISLFSEMAKKSAENSPQTNQYLQRIGERSRESIEKMGDIIWSINPDNDSLQQMLVKMKVLSNELFESKDCNVHWQEDATVYNLKLDMQQRKNFYLLFKEAINNAAKYSGAKNIFIRLASDKKSLHLIIQDDGKGFDLKNVQMGNGIKNMHHRSASLKGQVLVHSEPGNGTSVSLTFPY